MSSKAALRATAALAGALAVALSAGSAYAVPSPEIPADVAAAFAGPALRQVHAASAGAGADFPADMRAENVHEVFMFSAEFVAGDPTSEPLTSSDSWIGGLWRGDRAVGVLWVGKRDGGPAELQGFSEDADLALALADVPPTDVFIDDAPSGSYYALDGTTVRPLNSWARDALPAPAELPEYQESVAEQYALRVAQSADAATDERWGIIGGSVGVVAVLALVFGGIVLLARRRRPGRDHGAGTTA